MGISKQLFANYIKQFQFRELFNEMGWNNDNINLSIILDDQIYNLQSVAEKSGFKILICQPCKDGKIPNYATRKRIETKTTKLFQEHLIIFCDENKQEQIWQLVVRQINKPTKLTETRYNIFQEPELLYQRSSGLFFELDEEDKITIVDVTKRVAENFQANAERVTKHFYERFKKEHTVFLDFIKGIEGEINRDWYASLMLNRLMFCYFIQRKGFLDNNKNYLSDKLTECKEKRGKNKFYTFYRDFLLVLFHKGLGCPDHSKELKKEIGRVPYLNGGLFDVHELEKSYKNIQIEDNAFEKIFNFFNEYAWHLDTKITATGKDINPDVIGYIFEKYINDRAAMGAYYTKEDITDYISKNCVIPFLFDEIKRNYPKSFNKDSFIWKILKESDDTYIYDAVKYGIPKNSENVFFDLPEEIAIGLDTSKPNLLERRKNWNKPAPGEIGLPTEIWREVIERRKKYQEVRNKIVTGEIKEINDFITYNLNIRQFAQDVVENINDPEFIKHFYKALTKITILDPTCGSGAFLFAALNVLEPLYESCLERMENYVKEARKGKYKYFEEVLEYVKSPQHPNLKYFVYKSIILQNLYGVDIMNEAVEIAKLRLFLKLVATVDVDYTKPNLGLEPLPDIDFNIRAGNTLIGFVNKEEIEKSLEGKLDFDNDLGKIEEKCDIIAHTFTRYKKIQLTYGDDYEQFRKAKEELNKRLKELSNELNILLHKQYYSSIEYKKWIATHQPFHWFAEFYEIIYGNGGFDIVIGNPPYVEYSKVRDTYQIFGYETENCGNLYAFVMERCFQVLNSSAKYGMIIPISIATTDRMKNLQKIVTYYLNWLSFFSERPSKLFDGAEQELAIIINDLHNKENKTYTTNYIKWYSELRFYKTNSLFENIYYKINKLEFKNRILRINNDLEISIYKKFLKKSDVKFEKIIKNDASIWFHKRGRYWLKAIDFNKIGNTSIEFTSIWEALSINKKNINFILCLLNSAIFYWLSKIAYNTRILTSSEIIQTPINIVDENKFTILKNKLMTSYKNNAELKEIEYKTGTRTQFLFYAYESKPIIDEIDKVLAEHYGFTEEELDFIINYDIKYRMGNDKEDVE